jgi:hypothetical protein
MQFERQWSRSRGEVDDEGSNAMYEVMQMQMRMREMFYYNVDELQDDDEMRRGDFLTIR